MDIPSIRLTHFDILSIFIDSICASANQITRMKYVVSTYDIAGKMLLMFGHQRYILLSRDKLHK